jgi:hypothetical protein
MLTALILVCSLATFTNDCTRDNALDLVYVPATFTSPVTLLDAWPGLSGRQLDRSRSLAERNRQVICLPGPINRVDKAETSPGRWAR